MTRLIAGPYLGEFGWELCSWNPRVRALARRFDEVVVLAPASSRFLYADFAHAFHAVAPVEGASEYMLGELFGPAPEIPGHGWRVSPTRAIARQELRAFGDPEAVAALEAVKVWRRFASEPLGSGGVPPFDVALALRPGKLVQGRFFERKAWSQTSAEEAALQLMERGLRLAAIGGPENRTVAGAIDLRGAPLEWQVAALTRAGVALGPSSGPLHLAQLCGCPVVTWYDASPEEIAASRARYEGAWNPWRTPLAYLDRAPSPSAAEVVRAVLELLESAKRREDAG